MPPEPAMPGSPKHWLEYANSDLLLAKIQPKGVLLEMLCFHAQQAAEKAIKSVLLAQGIEFPRTHNVRILLELLPDKAVIPDLVWNAAKLTRYAVTFRYPGDFEPVTDTEHAEALTIAEAVTRWASQAIGG